MEQFLFTIFYMQNSTYFKTTFDYVILVFLACSVIISFSGKSSIANLFRFKIFNFLGKYSLYLFLVHHTFTRVLPVILKDYTLKDIYIVYIILSFVAAFLLMFIEKYLMKLLFKIKNIILNQDENNRVCYANR